MPGDNDGACAVAKFDVMFSQNPFFYGSVKMSVTYLGRECEKRTTAEASSPVLAQFFIFEKAVFRDLYFCWSSSSVSNRVCRGDIEHVFVDA